MKKYFWIIAILITAIMLFLAGRSCAPVKENAKSIPDTIVKLKVQIDTLTIKVEKLKYLKSEIHYRTKFDTIATIDTVITELIRCDSANRYADSIIASQDTIIQDQKYIIAVQDTAIVNLTGRAKKAEKKVLFWKATALIGWALNLFH